jgi:quercetin dioxygenase-like cupin family protein
VLILNQKFLTFKLEEVEGFDTLEGFMKPLSINEYVSVINTTIPPNMKVRPHAHKSNGVILVLKGSIDFVSDGTSFNLGQGSVAVIPAGTEVGLNNSIEPTELLMVSAPPSCKSVEELKTRLSSFNKRS